ncbi:MAG: VWA domain-containing protein [Acidobacteria bacterium]|nr:VWA domain-containing protein [Acidobacteriota bacterium]
MIFESPRWLFALLALPIIAAAEMWLTSRDRDRLARLVARPLWGRVVRRPHERWRWIRLSLLLLGAAGVIVALARPQWGIVREKIEREGVDVVLALDTSASMATPDVAPNRFFLARQALLQLMTRLEGDRFALVAFEGEAYPLAPLTLDADAVGLFLETAEPGIVPAPGTSLGVGLAKGLDAFVDKERRNKVLVLVSDGENLEGGIDDAVQQAKDAGIVVHTVGVGTEAGQPVPAFDAEGRQTGYKRDASGQPVVSRLNTATLEAIAEGTGGRFFRLTPSDTSLGALASVIEGMERRALAREWSYRRRERYQGPLAFGLACLAGALLLPFPRLRRESAEPVGRLAARVTAVMATTTLLGAAIPSHAQTTAGTPAPTDTLPAPPAAQAPPDATEGGGALDEVLLRPRRLTERGRQEYESGNHPQALEAFEGAARARPEDPAVRFNMADGLYKNGRYDEAATLFRSLGRDATAPFAPAARFNLGNSLYQKQDYKGAIQAYRDALRVAPNDEDTRRNLELALRQLKEQEEQQKRQQEQQQKQDQEKQQQKDQQGQDQQQPPEEQKAQQQKQNEQTGQQPQQGQRPQTPEEKEDQRFREQTGMPKERAMQLLDALEENEKVEQKRLLAEQRAKKKTGKDW